MGKENRQSELKTDRELSIKPTEIMMDMIGFIPPAVLAFIGGEVVCDSHLATILMTVLFWSFWRSNANNNKHISNDS